MNLSSKLLSNAVEEISKLPGIGKSTALRLALHLVNKEKGDIDLLIKSNFFEHPIGDDIN